MHYSHKTKHQVLSGVLALILSLSLLLPTIPTVWADEAADPETVIESVTDQLAAAGETTTPVTESEPARPLPPPPSRAPTTARMSSR